MLVLVMEHPDLPRKAQRWGIPTAGSPCRGTLHPKTGYSGHAMIGPFPRDKRKRTSFEGAGGANRTRSKEGGTEKSVHQGIAWWCEIH